MKVKIIDESGLTRPYISKKAMYNIIAKKDKYIADRDYKIKCARHDSEQWMHLAEEEKLMINELTLKLEKQRKLTYFVGACTTILGAVVGYICG